MVHICMFTVSNVMDQARGRGIMTFSRAQNSFNICDIVSIDYGFEFAAKINA